MPQPGQTADFFRQPLAEMIDLHHPLAVLASRLPWAQIEAALAPHFARQAREGRAVAQDDLFGPSVQVAGGAVAAAGRPRLPIRLMASLLYLKHANKLSDEELVQRWAENVVWQHFSGMRFYEPRLPCDATQIGRFRSRPCKIHRNIQPSDPQRVLRACVAIASAAAQIHSRASRGAKSPLRPKRTIARSSQRML